VPLHRPNRHRGFTLIEVLVALAIAGLVLAAVAGVFGTGALGHEIAADANIALDLAEEKLTDAEAVATVRPGRNGGVYAGRFDWQVSIGAYENRAEAAAATNPPSGVMSSTTFRLYRIEASVAWRDGRHRRQLALSTLRLLPEPP
jgi:prepilin-type N-terminal cleavage/methylation domain-containing protein